MRVNLKEQLKKGFTVIPNEAIETLSDATLKIFCYLIKVAGYDKPFTSYEKILNKLGKSKKTLLKSIKELRDLKVLTSRGTGIDTVWIIDFAPFFNEQNSENDVTTGVQREPQVGVQREPQVGVQREPQVGVQREPQVGVQREPQINNNKIRTNNNKKEKKIKEKKERFDFVQRVSSDLTNEQIDSILRELKIEDDVKVHPNDKYYYKVRGKLSSQGGVSLMLSYIILKSENKKGDLLKLLNNPQGFCNEVTNKGF